MSTLTDPKLFPISPNGLTAGGLSDHEKRLRARERGGSSGGGGGSGSVIDATTLVKGIVQLAGDLGGTASLPTVKSKGFFERLIVSGAGLAATSLATDTAPVAGIGTYVAIDPFTADCEIRRITGVSGMTVSWNDALAYAHAAADRVIFFQSDEVSVSWFGVITDGSTSGGGTDNEANLQRALEECARYGINLDCAVGTMACSLPIVIPSGPGKFRRFTLVPRTGYSLVGADAANSPFLMSRLGARVACTGVASTNRISVVGHGLSAGDSMIFKNSSIGGVTPGRVYYAKTIVDVDTITLSATRDTSYVPGAELDITSNGSAECHLKVLHLATTCIEHGTVDMRGLDAVGCAFSPDQPSFFDTLRVNKSARENIIIGGGGQDAAFRELIIEGTGALASWGLVIENQIIMSVDGFNVEACGKSLHVRSTAQATMFGRGGGGGNIAFVGKTHFENGGVGAGVVDIDIEGPFGPVLFDNVETSLNAANQTFFHAHAGSSTPSFYSLRHVWFGISGSPMAVKDDDRAQAPDKTAAQFDRRITNLDVGVSGVDWHGRHYTSADEPADAWINAGEVYGPLLDVSTPASPVVHFKGKETDGTVFDHIVGGGAGLISSVADSAHISHTVSGGGQLTSTILTTAAPETARFGFGTPADSAVPLTVQRDGTAAYIQSATAATATTLAFRDTTTTKWNITKTGAAEQNLVFGHSDGTQVVKLDHTTRGVLVITQPTTIPAAALNVGIGTWTALGAGEHKRLTIAITNTDGGFNERPGLTGTDENILTDYRVNTPSLCTSFYPFVTQASNWKGPGLFVGYTANVIHLERFATTAITSMADNGSGKYRVTSTAHGAETGWSVTVSGVAGAGASANGSWVVTKVDANTLDLAHAINNPDPTFGGSGTGTLQVHIYKEGFGAVFFNNIASKGQLAVGCEVDVNIQAGMVGRTVGYNVTLEEENNFADYQNPALVANPGHYTAGSIGFMIHANGAGEVGTGVLITPGAGFAGVGSGAFKRAIVLRDRDSFELFCVDGATGNIGVRRTTNHLTTLDRALTIGYTLAGAASTSTADGIGFGGLGTLYLSATSTPAITSTIAFGVTSTVTGQQTTPGFFVDTNGKAVFNRLSGGTFWEVFSSTDTTNTGYRMRVNLLTADGTARLGFRDGTGTENTLHKVIGSNKIVVSHSLEVTQQLAVLGGTTFTGSLAAASGQISITTGLAVTGGALNVGTGQDIRFATSGAGTKIGQGATELFAFWGKTPTTQRAFIAAPTGGAVIDAEARTAIDAIRQALIDTGIKAAS